MSDVRLHIRLAAIGMHGVAVLERCRARRDEAHARRASLAGIGQVTRHATSTTIRHARRRIDFATIGARIVAIAEPRSTRRYFARPRDAGRRGIGQIARIVTTAAMCEGRIRIRIASVCRIVITDGRTSRASERLADDGHDDVGRGHSVKRDRNYCFGGREHFGRSF